MSPWLYLLLALASGGVLWLAFRLFIALVTRD
jgi:hypothetical protein